MKNIFSKLYNRIGLTTLGLVFGVFGFGQANNNPCNNAPMINTNTNCVYTTGTTVGATEQTNGANFGSPSCGSMGEDVWYAFVAPISGSVTITTLEGGITDLVMALYESDCVGSYTELDCSDDVNNSMPEITNGGLTPGQTYYIRLWEYAGGTGTFDICVVENPPPPPGTDNENCAQMSPICTDAGISFTANTGIDDADILDPGNNYDCLSTQPNPTWFYFQIETAGTIDMNLTAASDIDFIIWGPYNNLAQAQNDCGGMGVGPNNVVDCSYSFTNDEFPTIPGASVGDVYVMLITNYANVTQQIDLQQTGGVGATDCDIVFPSCIIDNFSANISACDPTTNTYSVSGTIDVTDPPATGTLIIEDCNGNQQTINPPFAASINYNLTGLNADGAACDVTTYFTDDLACTQTITYTAPAACNIIPCAFTAINTTTTYNNCDAFYTTDGSVEFTDAPTTGQLVIEDCDGNSVSFNAPFTSPQNFLISSQDPDGNSCEITAYFTDDLACTISSSGVDAPSGQVADDAGTFTQSMSGNGTNNFILCDQDQFTFSSNGDATLTPGNPPNNDPGILYLIYSCPPTVFGPNIDPTTDPCFVGFWNAVDDITITNDGGLADPNVGGDLPSGVDQTLYFVPLTLNSFNTLTYWTECYQLDVADMATVQYLNPIIFTEVPDCPAGTQTVTLNGGYPEFSGGAVFTASNLSPANANFVNNTTGNGGTIVIDGLVDGDVVSFDIVDDNGCPLTITLAPFLGPEDPGFSYPAGPYCSADSDPSAAITGDPGTFTSAPGGLVINAGTGAIDLDASTPGTYNVTYTTGGGITCPTDSTVQIVINETPTVNPVADQTLCVGENTTLVTFTGTPAGVSYDWTSNNTGTGVGAGGNGTIPVFTTTNPSTVIQEISVITVTPTLNGCVGTPTNFSYIVNPLPIIDVGPDLNICIGSNVTLTATGGTVYTWDNGLGVGNNFVVSPAVTTTYIVTGLDAAGCAEDDTITVNVGSFIPTVSNDTSICLGFPANISAFGGVSYTWDQGVGAGQSHSVTPAATTTYTVTATDAGGCVGNASITVTIDPIPTVDPITDQTLCIGANTTLVTFTGTAGSTFDWVSDNTGTGVGASGAGTIAVFTGLNPNSGIPEISTITVTPTSPAGCVGTPETFTFTINPLPIIDAGPDLNICIGGSVTLTASGGATYIWDQGVGAGNNISVSPAVTTTYVVVGTNANGCVEDDTITVNVGSFIPTVSNDTSICLGFPANISAFGGVSYVWDQGVGAGQSHSVTPVATTTYTVTATDAGGCVGDASITVTIDPVPTVDPIADQTLCIGANTTLVTFTGTAGSTFDWVSDNTGTGVGASGAGTIAVFTGLNPNSGIPEISTITVTPTSAAGCVGTPETFTFTINPLPVIDAGPDLNMCVGGNVTLSASGATSYMWNQGVGAGNNIVISPAVTTTYVVVGTDANGCVEDDTITVNVGSFIPTVSNDTSVCAGFPANISAFGGVSYTWDQGVGAGQSHSVTPVATTIYTVTATDAGGCVGTASITVTIDPIPTVDPIADQEICIGANTTLVTFTGTAGSTFDWVSDNTGTGVGASGSGTIAVFTGLNPNSGIPEISTITVTPTSAAGCVGTPETFTFTINPLPNIDAGPDASICVGGNAVLTGNGGATYVWDNGLGAGNNFNVSPAIATTYVVIGTDANGCVEDDTIVVSVGSLIPTISPSITICSGDDTTITANGGVSYTWDQGLGTGQSQLVSPVVTTTYTVTATDGGGCVGDASVTVTVNALPTIVADPDAAICIGESITFGVSGAVNYVWDNGLPGTASHTISPVATTTYVVVGTDANGCVEDDTITITVNPLPTIDAGPDLNICTGSNATLTAVGGATYVWDNGLGAGNGFVVSPVANTTYVVVGTDANGCVEDDTITVNVGAFIPTVNNDTTMCIGESYTISGFGGATYTWDQGLGAGQSHTVSPITTTVYTVTGTDAGGCQGVASVTVNINALPIVVVDPDAAICIGESITFGVSGAVNYVWDNGLPGTASHTISPVATTTYVVVGTDANGCVEDDTITITVNPLPTIDAGPDLNICTGSNATLTAVGGATYVWDNGLGAGNGFVVSPIANTTYIVVGTDANGCVEDDTITVNVGAFIPTVNNDTTMCVGESYIISGFGGATYTWDQGLGAGQSHTVSPVATTTYTVTGTDAGSCQGTATVTVNINALPNVVADPDAAICIGESITFGVSGAVNYVWDNGLPGTASHTISPIATTTYVVVGTDANGCVEDDAITITVNPLPTIDAGPDLNICTGSNATLTAVGGATYVWDNGLGAGNGFVVSPVANTTYVVVGTDANGCVEDDTITVNVGAFIPTVNNDTTMCIGESYTISGFGGATYTWDQGLGAGQTHVVSPVVTTTYTVTGTDVGACQGIATVTVNINSLPNVVADPDITMCINEDTIVNANGAVNYVWDQTLGNGQSHVVTPIITTIYTVVGTDVNGCVNTDQMTITINTLPIVDAGIDQLVCPATNVTLSGAGAVNYVWDNGVTDGVAFVAPLINTIYTVIGTDANGCVNTDDVLVSIEPNPNMDAGQDTTICVGESVTLSATGADTYTWDNGLGIGQTHVVSPLVTTTYIVEGQTFLGCSGFDTVVVTVNSLPIVDAGTDQTVCEGTNVTLSGSGADVYVWDNGVSDGVSFVANLSQTYTVIGTDVNGCVGTDQVLVNVNTWDDSTFQYDASTFCVTGTDPIINFTGTPGGTFSSLPAGLTLDPVTGAITLISSSDGTYTVTYTTNGSCPTSLIQPMEVTNTAVADFTFSQYCLNGSDPLPTFINAGTGGVFSVAPAGVVIDPVSGLIDLDASAPGVYTVTNDINIVGCAAVQAQSPLEIFDLPTLMISGGGTICQGDPLPDVQFDMTGSGDWSFQYDVSTSGSGNVTTNTNPYIIQNALEGVYDLLGITDNITGCTNTALGSVEVIINITPILQPIADAGICDGDQYLVPSFTANTSGTTFDWVNTTVDVGFGMSGSGNIGTFTGVNTGSTPLVAFIEVTPTLGSCVGLPVTFKITVNPIPVVDISVDINPTCLPVNVTLDNLGTPTSNCTWIFGDGTTESNCGATPHIYITEGCYDVSLSITDAFGCSNSQTVVDAVCLEPNPIANFVFNPPVTDVSATEIEFDNLSENATNYVWDFGDQSGISNVEHPVHMYSDTAQEYIITLVAINDLGCTDTAFSKIIIHDVLLYWVPNAFTPDNDEYNQTFKPVFTSGFDPYDYNLLIFDRWGELIFESHNSEVGWDGRFRGNFVQDGVYVWKIEFKETMTDKRHKVFGHVSILR